MAIHNAFQPHAENQDKHGVAFGVAQFAFADPKRVILDHIGFIRAHYHPNYYGAFVIGPDGHNIEAVCHEPAA